MGRLLVVDPKTHCEQLGLEGYTVRTRVTIR